MQFNSTNFAISRATAATATASVCPAICQVFVHSQQQAGGGEEKVEEEQEKYNCNHSWVIHESPDVGAMWLPLSPLTVLWVC